MTWEVSNQIFHTTYVENGKRIKIYFEIVSCQEQNQVVIYCIKLRPHANSTTNANVIHTHKSTHTHAGTHLVSISQELFFWSPVNECLHS